MHNQPLVSIIVCTYNGELYLAMQLDSIFQQTYPNLEIIAIDDCSTDDTMDILYKYAKQHKNLRVLQNTTNIGYIKNFEKGISLCKGEFIALCDQDDVWLSNKIEVLVQNIDNYYAIYSDSILTDTNLNSLNKKLSDIKNLATYDNCLFFVTDNCVAGHAMLIRKELYHLAFPFPNYIPHDYWLAYISSLYGGIKYINVPLTKYRNHGKNVIGAIQMKNKRNIQKKINNKREQHEIIRKRIELFYNICDSKKKEEKNILFDLTESYKSFSLKNNIKRVQIFLNHRKQLLAIKKRSALRKWFFCFKMFFKIK